MARYLVANGPMPTTTAFAPVTTGTSLKTLLQVKPFNVCHIVEWGISFNGSVAATPGKVELLETGTIAATVTAHVDADIMKYDGAEGAVASIAGLTLATSGTGYTSNGTEGSITTSRVFDLQLLSPTAPYVKQFPLGERPKLLIGNITRIRVHFAAAIDAICYMVLEM